MRVMIIIMRKVLTHRRECVHSQSQLIHSNTVDVLAAGSHVTISLSRLRFSRAADRTVCPCDFMGLCESEQAISDLLLCSRSLSLSLSLLCELNTSAFDEISGPRTVYHRDTLFNPWYPCLTRVLHWLAIRGVNCWPEWEGGTLPITVSVLIK